MTIKNKIKNHIISKHPRRIFRAKDLWWDVFRYGVARGSVTKALSELAKEGIVRKSRARGKNSSWVIVEKE
jgi:hypothetical protein